MENVSLLRAGRRMVEIIATPAFFSLALLSTADFLPGLLLDGPYAGLLSAIPLASMSGGRSKWIG